MADVQGIITMSRNKLKWTIRLTSLLLIMVLFGLVNEYATAERFWGWYFLRQWRSPESVTFFAGTEGGVYSEIGKKIAKRSQSEDFKITDITTDGSIDNLSRLSRTPNSFALVQADSLAQSNIMFGEVGSGEIKLIAPLYVELLHLVLRNEKNESIQGSNNNLPPQHDRLRQALDDKVIVSGHFLSATNSYAAAVLDIIDANPRQNLYDADLEDCMDRLRSPEGSTDRVDAVFFMSGVPAPAIKDAFGKEPPTANSALKLLPVTGSFPAVLQRKYKIPVIRTNIPAGIYHKNQPNVSTVGSPAWLVASKDVTTHSILAFLRTLQTISEKSGNMEEWLPPYFLDAVKNTLSKYENIRKVEAKEAHSRMLVFLGTCLVSLFPVCLIVVPLFSKYLQSEHFKEIHKTYRDHLKIYTELENTEGPDPARPSFDGDEGEKRLSTLVKGISELHIRVQMIREDYDKGALMIMDMRFLLERLYGVMEIFHRKVAWQLSKIVRGGGDQKQVAEYAERYLITGYLTIDDYKWLKELMNPQRKAPSKRMNRTGRLF